MKGISAAEVEQGISDLRFGHLLQLLSDNTQASIILNSQRKNCTYKVFCTLLQWEEQEAHAYA